MAGNGEDSPKTPNDGAKVMKHVQLSKGAAYFRGRWSPEACAWCEDFRKNEDWHLCQECFDKYGQKWYARHSGDEKSQDSTAEQNAPPT